MSDDERGSASTSPLQSIQATSQEWRTATASMFIAVLAASPAALDITIMPIWIVEGFSRFWSAIFTYLAGAFIWIIGWIALRGTEIFLFFPPPSQIVGLESMWQTSVGFYVAYVTLGGMTVAGMYMFFPENEDADIFRFFERLLASAIAVVIFGPLISGWDIMGYESVDLYSAAVIAVNELAGMLYPTHYGVDLVGDAINGIMGGIAEIFAGAAILVISAALIILMMMFSISILLLILAFYGALAMRMLLVYTVYGMLPILLAFWTIDVGPLKYAKIVSSIAFKLTGVLLVLGIVVAGVLGATSAIAATSGPDNDDPGDAFADVALTDEEVSSDEYDPAFEDPGDRPDEDAEESDAGQGTPNVDGDSAGQGSAADSPPILWNMMASVMALIAGWSWSFVLLTLIPMKLGLAGGMGRMGRRRGSSSMSGGAKQGSQSGSGGDGMTISQDDDGNVFVEGEDGGFVTDGETAVQYGTEEEGPESATFREKGGYLDDEYTDGAIGDTIDQLGEAKKAGSEATDKIAKGASKRGTDFQKKTTETFESAGSNIGEGEAGAGLGRVAGHAVGAAGNVALTSAGYATKAPEYASRAGKSLYSIGKQPTIEDSIDEAGRIARESPVGEPPDGYGSPTEQQGTDAGPQGDGKWSDEDIDNVIDYGGGTDIDSEDDDNFLDPGSDDGGDSGTQASADPSSDSVGNKKGQSQSNSSNLDSGEDATPDSENSISREEFIDDAGESGTEWREDLDEEQQDQLGDLQEEIRDSVSGKNGTQPPSTSAQGANEDTGSSPSSEDSSAGTFDSPPSESDQSDEIGKAFDESAFETPDIRSTNNIETPSGESEYSDSPRDQFEESPFEPADVQSDQKTSTPNPPNSPSGSATDTDASKSSRNFSAGEIAQGNMEDGWEVDKSKIDALRDDIHSEFDPQEHGGSNRAVESFIEDNVDKRLGDDPDKTTEIDNMGVKRAVKDRWTEYDNTPGPRNQDTSQIDYK